MNDAEGVVPREAVAAQLERLCASSTLKHSFRLCRFLRYTIEATLRGQGDTLKEYVIGVEVYDRRPPYHPSQDSIVRTEAKRLRNKLKEYYETEGAEDDVLIYYRSGTYQPMVRQSTPVQKAPATPAVSTLSTSGETLPGVTIAVLPFRYQEGDLEAATIAAGITDDLIFQVSATAGCRVVDPHSLALAQSHVPHLPSMLDLSKVDQVISGSVRRHASHVRVSVTGAQPSGTGTWSVRFDMLTNGNDPIALEEQTASAIMVRVAPQNSALRNMQMKVPPDVLIMIPEVFIAEADLDEGSSPCLHAALSQFERLLLLQPASPRLRCGIVACYYSLAMLGELSTGSMLERAKAVASDALKLDPSMGEVHAAMGCAFVLQHEGQSAERTYHSALSLSANPTIRHKYADLLMAHGRFQEASLQLQKAHRLDPFSHRQRVSVARLRYLTWDPHNDPHTLEEEQYGPPPTQVVLFQAELSLRTGRMADAVALVDTILSSPDQGAATLSEIAAILALAGQLERAHALIDHFALLAEDAPVSKTYQARLRMALQEEEACVALLHLAADHREPQLYWLENDPKFAGLQSKINYKLA